MVAQASSATDLLAQSEPVPQDGIAHPTTLAIVETTRCRADFRKTDLGINYASLFQARVLKLARKVMQEAMQID